MISVLTAEDVRRQDAGSPVPVAQLMQNAGWAVARAARRMLGGTYGRRIVVVCGKGNNGGDGFVAARIVHDHGAHVVAVALSDELSPLAAQARASFRGPILGLAALQKELARADLVIDAIFGVGTRRAPEGAYARAIELISAAGAPVLAVDVPSGIDSDTGAAFDPSVRATQTVTFTGLKPGLLFAPGASLAGFVEVVDIGIHQLGDTVAMTRHDVARLVPRRAVASHKRSAGTVLVVAGSRAMPGAAALVTAAAVHAGAGLTTLCAPEDVCRVVLSRVPEITTIPVPESSEGTIDLKAMDLLRPRLPEFRALAIGPGLTTHPATVDFVHALLRETTHPAVLDADALNAFAGNAAALAGRPDLVLTPHAGELARLLGTSSAELDADRLTGARRAAHQLAGVVVFKGPGTVIAGRSSRTYVNPTGGRALAQGGTGDVLTGIIAALIAQAGPDADLQAMAALGVWLHGFAADRIAARIAPHPANATALIGELGPAIHEVCG